MAVDLRSRYLDLLKKSLLNELYLENELRILYLIGCTQSGTPVDYGVLHDIARCFPEQLEKLAQGRDHGRFIDDKIENAVFSHTMIGHKRLDNLEYCLSRVIDDKIPGDVMECGVWRGGATIFMRGFLAAHAADDRTVWVADSFEGLPKPSVEQDKGLDLSKKLYPMLSVDLDTVKANFRRYGLLDEQVRFIKGWFRDTLPTAPIERLSVLRLDGDLYESTMDALNALYDKLSIGGYVIIDDYCIPNCKDAVRDFRLRRGIEEPVREIDWTGVYWKKEV